MCAGKRHHLEPPNDNGGGGSGKGKNDCNIHPPAPSLQGVLERDKGIADFTAF